MIYGQFLIGLFLYMFLASSSYHEAFKSSPYYFPAGITAGIFTSILWMNIAKADSVPSSLMLKGLAWDAMLMMCYLLVPIFFFGAKFTTVQGIGIGLTVIGLFMTKL